MKEINNAVCGENLILVIYDIPDNRRRNKMAKFLCGYGMRVQKSAFEAYLNEKLYAGLLKNIEKYIAKEDNIRIYKLTGSGKVTSYGCEQDYRIDDVVIV